jgi:hypothetical protein
MIWFTVLVFILAALVLGAMSVLGQQDQDACDQPAELIPDYCLPQPTSLPTATAWSTEGEHAGPPQPYPGPYPFPLSPVGGKGLELNSFLKTYLALLLR